MESKVTEWFPVGVKPAYEGEYEYDLGVCVTLREWRGGYWRTSSGAPLTIMRGDRWRGLLKEA
jgi:hypothetical protein